MTLVDQLRLATLIDLRVKGGRSCMRDLPPWGYRAVAELILDGLAYEDEDELGNYILCITREGIEALTDD